ncbi:MAG: ABC transporter ATP-binding protein [Burkholderiaceae bacterium]|jgi:glycerol transport system ATP-binding protein
MTLSLNNVSVSVGADTVLHDLSLTLAPGSMNVLLGPTLSGKTTLMRLMAGLDKPTSGVITVNGQDASNIPVRRRSVAMVYQQFVNYPTLTVYENIASPLRVAKLSRDEVDARVQRVAKVLKLEPLLNRLPNQISGGQQQRTAIARAIAKGAELVLLDEPLANLDYKLREELREELPRILGESGAILVYATTEPLEALLLGGNTAALSEGRLIQFGPTPSVYHNPNHIEAARVFSDPPLNEMPISKRDGAVHFGDAHQSPAIGLLAHLPDGSYTLAFRPDIVSLGKPWETSLSFPGEVSVAEISGSESFVHLDTPVGRLICVEAGVSVLQPQQSVDVHVDATRVVVFDRSGALAAASQRE